MIEPISQPKRSRAMCIAIDDADLHADVRAVLAALALEPLAGGAKAVDLADVVITDQAGTELPSSAMVIRVVTDAKMMAQHSGDVSLGGSNSAGSSGPAPIPLPSETSRLVEVLQRHSDPGEGLLIAVAGAVGGCGSSTLASVLALRAGLSYRALLIEADPAGVGLDVHLGLEGQSDLGVDDVRAELGSPDPQALWDAVPKATGSEEGRAGTAVLARSARPSGERCVDPFAAARRAALAHRAAGHIAICDVGRVQWAGELLAAADHIVLVTRCDLAGALAAARAIMPSGPPVHLVIRSESPAVLDPEDVFAAVQQSGKPLTRWWQLSHGRGVAASIGSGELVRHAVRDRGGPLRSLTALGDRLLSEVGAHEGR